MPYNETTIINGKQITLTPEEKKGVEEFHKSRIAFAFLNDGNCAINIKDVREHKIYLQEDFGISFDEFENLTRGYIKPGRIVFYKTSEFIPIENITEKVLSVISEKALEFFGPGKYEIWNGLKIGKPGEEWKPIQRKGFIFVS